MQINNKFQIGAIVYLKTDIEQLPRIIIGILIYPDNGLVYKCGQSTDDDWHYEIELSDTVDILLKTSN
jgi:hypothetical protein